MARAIGIDLGTTNSCAAVIEDGKARVLTYPSGAKTIPSVFAIDKSGNRLVGEEARQQGQANPLNTVAASKRLIGRSFDSDAVEQMQQVFTYEIVEGDQEEVLIKVSGQVLTLEQISAAILARIKDNAERVLEDDVDEAVITVPAYFNDRQRQAVKAAGRLAGLHVLRVLNEPTAAALAYGLGKTLHQRVAIYDLGGGTFDISIIDIKDKRFEVLATGGDTFLGGVDFDDRIMQHILKRVLIAHDVDLSYDRHAIARIRDAAEDAKIALSSVESFEIDLPQIGADLEGKPLHFRLTLTRKELEGITVDLVERSINTCERILHEAGTRREQIDELLLVGGQSRMPLVRRRLTDFLGRPPSEKVHPDEAVAIGAAIMAKSLAGKVAPDEKDVTLRDALPIPIGVGLPNGRMRVLFDRNTPLPARKTSTLVTSKDDQKTIALHMFQGTAEQTADCEPLGSFVFYGLRDAPAGEVQLEVTFHIDSQGMLNLSARDKDTGDTIESTIRLGEDAGRRKKKRKKPVAPGAPAFAMPVASAAAGMIDPHDELDLPPVPEAEAPRPRASSGPLPPPDDTPAHASKPVRGSSGGALAESEPGIDNLRSQLRRPAAPVEDDRGGVVGWFKSLFGAKR